MSEGADQRADAGDVYAIPVRDEGWAICRVLRRDGTETFGRLVLDAFTVELAEWTEERLPSLEEALAAETIVLSHYRLFPVARERPARFRVTGFLPTEFVLLGRDHRSPPEVASHGPGALDWAFLPDEVFFERVYRRAPETFSKTYASLQRERHRRAIELMKRIAARGPGSSTARAAALDWPPSVPDAAVQEARRLLEQTTRKLRDLKTTRSKSDALRKCVLAFNRLDEAHGGIIDTVVAEEIVLTLVGAGEAAGVRSAEELIESAREF